VRYHPSLLGAGFSYRLSVRGSHQGEGLGTPPAGSGNCALQRARLESTRAIAAAMSAGTRELLGHNAASQLNTDLAAFAVVSGAIEVTTAWLRGEFDTSREHVADLVAGLLLATADISTGLPESVSQPR
jgi:hypothetical protein